MGHPPGGQKNKLMMQQMYIPKRSELRPHANGQIAELHRDSHQSRHPNARGEGRQTLDNLCSATARATAELCEMHRDSHQMCGPNVRKFSHPCAPMFDHAGALLEDLAVNLQRGS